jgi:hypothetical protein
MNFVLDILGRSHRELPTLGSRGGMSIGIPGTGEGSPGGLAGIGAGGLAAIRRAVLAGQFDRAAELLEEQTGDAVWALFARGQLRLMSGGENGYAEAAWCFAAGMERVMGAADGSLEVGAGSALERLIGAAEGALRAGRCGRAAGLFGEARGVVGELIAAEAGLCVAEGRLAGHMRAGRAERLVPLARLADVLLKAEARARLASSVSGTSKEGGRGREAAWMVGSGRVTELLEGEFDALAAASKRLRGHSEVHLRLGLLARALGRSEAAAWAFGEVLRVHPHHLSVAGWLSATLVELGEGSGVMAVLAVAIAATQGGVAAYDQLAAAVAHARTSKTGGLTFDAAVERFARSGAGSVGRANLAFALGELGMLDGDRAQWREVRGTVNSEL